MSQKSPPPVEHRPHRRAAWRQQLVQTERGLVGGVRSDSSFFVHFFGASMMLATSGVLGLDRMQWAVVLLCLTLVLCAEMFNHALRALADRDPDSPRHAPPLAPPHAPPGHFAAMPSPAASTAAQRILGMGSAAVMVAIIGAVVVIGLVFWERLDQLFPARG